MKYDDIKGIEGKKFRRLTGIKKKTFDIMVKILSFEQAIKKSRGGRPNKLSIEDMLLMTLEYWREYRTYFHIGISYGLAEANAYKGIKWVEDVLIRSRNFSLPSKRALLSDDEEIEVVLIDATETQIQRPKKTKKLLFREEEKTYIENPSGSK